MTGRGHRKRRDRKAFASPVAASFAALALLSAFAGCAPPPSSMTPVTGEDAFDVVSFFDGTSYSRGTVATAYVSTEAFTAEFAGRKNGRNLRLDEHFAFPDGAPLQRWDLTEATPGRYSGTVSTELDDGRMAPPVPVEGVAVEGGVVLAYDGYAPGGGNTLLGFRHEMTENADGTVANHVVVSKFGLPLASSDVTFAKTRAALEPYP